MHQLVAHDSVRAHVCVCVNSRMCENTRGDFQTLVAA